MKKFFQDFKKFISRGNIVDMAIGVIIGSAFSAIVTALTNKIIMPLINYVLSLGGSGLDAAFTFLRKVYATDGTVDLANSIYIDWGAFITAILNFLIIAMTLFIILKVAMKSSELLKGATAKVMTGKATKEEKAEMKTLGLNPRNKEDVKKYREDKVAAEEKAKAEAEEKARIAAEENARLHPTQEQLLIEIRDLLKNK